MMATVAKRLYKGSLLTSDTELYKVPAGKTAIVKAITICNAGSVAYTFDLQLAGTYITYRHTIKPFDTITIPYIDHVLEAGEAIRGMCSAQFLACYISGKEVT